VQTQVITSFSPRGAREYGVRGVKQFRRYSSLPLVVYLDRLEPIPHVEIRLTSDILGWPETKASLPMRNGKATKPERYTWQAQRFAVKPFVWWDAALRFYWGEMQGLESGVLMWMDGDTQAIAPVPSRLPVDLLGGADVAFLGRQHMHPETGCVVFRIPEALDLIDWCKYAYETGTFQGWTDGWTDCHALRHGIQATGIYARDLTSERYQGKSHIWPVSPLAPYFLHFKGKQKRLGVPA
jgi:hypothetical protein